MLKPVTVCITTYNRVDFIAKTLDSILAQKTNFEFEISISDDCSTDGTQNILLSYKEKHPKIKLILRDKNVKVTQNCFEQIQTVKSKYIALCDADDYWTDENKLQIQYDFLEKNDQYVLSFHNCFKFDSKTGKILDENYLSEDRKRDFTKDELLTGYHAPTSTLMFRNVSFLQTEDLKNFYHSYHNNDLILLSLLSNFGGAKYHDDILNTAFRVHDGSIYSSKSERLQYQEKLKSFQLLYDFYDNRQKKMIGQKIFDILTSFIICLLKEKKIQLAIKNYIKVISIGFKNILFFKTFKSSIRIFLSIFKISK